MEQKIYTGGRGENGRWQSWGKEEAVRVRWWIRVKSNGEQEAIKRQVYQSYRCWNAKVSDIGP